MSFTFGERLKITISGESHGPYILLTIDGIPSGEKINFENIQKELDRRLPGKDNLSTQRKELDNFELISGYFNGYTTGGPLSFLIKNTDTKSKDYERTKNIFRPGHADYPAYIKYKGFNDYRGGGFFSGRMTVAIVIAGSIAKDLLREKKIEILSHIKSIKNIKDKELEIKDLEVLRNREFKVIDDNILKEMETQILKAKEENDSVGGVVECVILNLEKGIGEPYFDSLESRLSHMMFSIPSIKGIEFGLGFDITKLYGSSANDNYIYKDNDVYSKTNNNGGILGGISTGMPIVFSLAVKPTPSIAKKQRTVKVSQDGFSNEELNIVGRHDPCIVKRILPVIEGAAAIVILDFILSSGGLHE